MIMIISFIVLPDHLEICTKQFATGAGASARTWCPSTAANCSNIWDGSSSRVSSECNNMSFSFASSFECRIILFGRIKLWMALCDGLWRYYNERITNTSTHPTSRIKWRPLPVWRVRRRPGSLRPDSFQASLARSISMAADWRVPLGTTKTRYQRYLWISW
jgi:hypothetical protein